MRDNAGNREFPSQWYKIVPRSHSCRSQLVGPASVPAFKNAPEVTPDSMGIVLRGAGGGLLGKNHRHDRCGSATCLWRSDWRWMTVDWSGDPLESPCFFALVRKQASATLRFARGEIRPRAHQQALSSLLNHGISLERSPTWKPTQPLSVSTFDG